MKKTITTKLFAMLMAICMLCLSACGSVAPAITEAAEDNGNIENVQKQIQAPTGTPSVSELSSNTKTESSTVPAGEYNEGIVLVKYDGEFTENVLAQLDFVSAEPLYKGSSWHTVTLGESMDTVEAVEYLTKLDCFEKVDYDYVMKADAEVESVDISGNTYAEDLTYLDTLGVKKGWENNANNKKNPGGSPDVVIAIIDTGVDYNHLDLRNNIWVNPAEIPDNGIDDDGNGYVDDIHGWNCVGDNNDPMDDNGHGTHVAGIAAAENNKIGTVGIAYNCKIMVLKAGNSSGYFNNSDIAEAVQYAYMNGASVINMSFGGESISLAVEEALENAYNTCVLVAAAGNDGLCNQPDCTAHLPDIIVSYPAALPYVIGVMSCNANGTNLSTFSNFDHWAFNKYEYEVFSCGESITSTWPNNKYATLSGTSMSAPTVAGIAALLRSAYPDRVTYSTKYLQSQIVNTGKVLIWEKSVANAYDALTKVPVPDVNLYDYYIDDDVSINSMNNGNGVIDAGETLRLYISLHNRGGVASNINVSIDTMRNNDPSLTDPYFTFVNSTIQLSDIGTYSVRESGDKYFEIIVDADCPNEYLIDFNIHFTYKNGLDDEDQTVYEDDGKQKAQFNVSKGYLLPAIISEDTVFTPNRLYIVGADVVIPKGVTVTFEAGCEIQFYDDRDYYDSPIITVYGTLNISGAQDKMVFIYPNEEHSQFICRFIIEEGGVAFLDYTKCINLYLVDRNYEEGYHSNWINSEISNSNVTSTSDTGFYSNGIMTGFAPYMSFGSITNNYIDIDSGSIRAGIIDSNYIILDGASVSIVSAAYDMAYAADGYGKFTNNIVYTSFNINKPSNDYHYDTRFLDIDGCDEVCNNLFFSSDNSNPRTFMQIGERDGLIRIANNAFAEYFYKYASQLIAGYYDESGNPTIDIYTSLSDSSHLWPYIVSIELFDKDGNPITMVGKEEIKVRVTFNRAMDTTQDTYMSFGTVEPYADYRIDGEWISDTVWEGTYTLKAQIENGQNFLKVNNAWAAEDPTKTVFSEYHLYEFTIDTTAAMSMNLLANPTDNGIELTWAQDDYDTLLGYNVYRADSKDGNYVKLNPAILLPDELTFLDENAEPGKTYWYTYTVVLTDFTESNPAGRVMATAKDTMAPSLYHTPVNQGYMNNNLVISCTASDNVAVSSVVLYYRTVGATEWKTLTMLKQNDKYSATVFGSELTLDGIEYYIVAYDTENSIAKGSADVPYTVVVKDASAISRIGDVDGDGTVTTKDALMLMQCLNEDIILSDDEFKRADLNGDGMLSAVEALRILQYINGNVTTLEM